MQRPYPYFETQMDRCWQAVTYYNQPHAPKGLQPSARLPHVALLLPYTVVFTPPIMYPTLGDVGNVSLDIDLLYFYLNMKDKIRPMYFLL